MPDTIEHEFRYRSEMYFLVAAPLFCGILAGWLGYFALTNDEPVWLGSLFEIPPPVVLVGAWLLAALFAFLFAGTGMMTVQALTCRQRIAFTATALLVPKKFWSSADRAIPYREITDLVTQTTPDGQQVLFVHHGREKFPIEERCLTSKADFDAICRVLGSRTSPPAEG